MSKICKSIELPPGTQPRASCEAIAKHNNLEKSDQLLTAVGESAHVPDLADRWDLKVNTPSWYLSEANHATVLSKAGDFLGWSPSSEQRFMGAIRQSMQQAALFLASLPPDSKGTLEIDVGRHLVEGNPVASLTSGVKIPLESSSILETPTGFTVFVNPEGLTIPTAVELKNQHARGLNDPQFIRRTAGALTAPLMEKAAGLLGFNGTLDGLKEAVLQKVSSLQTAAAKIAEQINTAKEAGLPAEAVKAIVAQHLPEKSGQLDQMTDEQALHLANSWTQSLVDEQSARDVVAGALQAVRNVAMTSSADATGDISVAITNNHDIFVGLGNANRFERLFDSNEVEEAVAGYQTRIRNTSKANGKLVGVAVATGDAIHVGVAVDLVGIESLLRGTFDEAMAQTVPQN